MCAGLFEHQTRQQVMRAGCIPSPAPLLKMSLCPQEPEWFYFFKLILERGREEERETDTDFLFHLLRHHRLIRVCALTGNRTHNLSVLQRSSNTLIYPASPIFAFHSSAFPLPAPRPYPPPVPLPLSRLIAFLMVPVSSPLLMVGL